MTPYETLAAFVLHSRRLPGFVHGIYRDGVLVSWSVHRNWAAREAGKRGAYVKRILLVETDAQPAAIT